MTIASRKITALAALMTLGAAPLAQAQSITLGFDDAVQGRRYYAYDASADGTPDLVLSTADPFGFNTFGPGPNMLYIQEPGIEGTALREEDLRVNFIKGATGSVAFSYALSTGSSAYGVKFSLYDVNGTALASTNNLATFQPTPAGTGSFPENRVSLAFSGTAAYGTFNFGTDASGNTATGGGIIDAPPSDAPGPIISGAPSRYIIDNLSFTQAGGAILPGYGGVLVTDPVLPQATITNPDGSVSFDFTLVTGAGGAGVEFPIYIDPAVAVGYEYQVKNGSKISAIIVPKALANGDGTFTLLIDGQAPITLKAGQEFDVLSLVPGGIDHFVIRGIDAAEGLDPANPQAFVTGLRFVEAGAVDVTQTALTQAVPEPGTWALMLGGFALLGARQRRRAGR